MEKARKIAITVTLVVAFCFVLVSLAEAGPNDPVTEQWAKKNLKNRKKTTSIPIWQITGDGIAASVNWIDHAPNPRFAIYDPGTPGDESDDLILDKETGLVWARDANLAGSTRAWRCAIFYCRVEVMLGNRKGWRLPTIEELSSLADPSETSPALPSGHPFVNVQLLLPYWSTTTHDSITDRAWQVHVSDGTVGYDLKTVDKYVWPVRGGNGYATGNW